MLSHYPHKCPACRCDAYVGAAPVDVDCSNHGCKYYRGRGGASPLPPLSWDETMALLGCLAVLP